MQPIHSKDLIDSSLPRQALSAPNPEATTLVGQRILYSAQEQENTIPYQIHNGKWHPQIGLRAISKYTPHVDNGKIHEPMNLEPREMFAEYEPVFNDQEIDFPAFANEFEDNNFMESASKRTKREIVLPELIQEIWDIICGYLLKDLPVDKFWKQAKHLIKLCNYSRNAALKYIPNVKIDCLANPDSSLASEKQILKFLEVFGSHLQFLNISSLYASKEIIARAAACSNIRKLDISANSDSVFDLIENAEFAKKLTDLDLEFSTIKRNNLKKILDIICEKIPHLKSLKLSQHPLSEEDLKIISQSSLQLRHLAFELNKFNENHLTLMLGSEKFSSLHSLKLCNNGIKLAEAKKISQNPHFQFLRSLDLSNKVFSNKPFNNCITLKGLEAIVSSSVFIGIVELRLANTNLNGDKNESFAKGFKLNLPKLEVLDLTCNHIDAQFLEVFFNFSLPALKTLSLARNKLRITDISLVANNSNLPNLVSLDLEGTGVGGGVCKIFTGSPYLGHLQSLNLANNKISEENRVALLEAESLPSLGFVKI